MNEAWSGRGSRSTARYRARRPRRKTLPASIAGGEPHLALRRVAQRKHREILVPARLAAERRNMQVPPDKPKQGVHVFGRNAFQCGIAADRAVSVERIAERHQPGVEASLAALTTPGVETERAQNVISRRLAARSSRLVALADGTVHLACWVPSERPTE